MNLPPELLLKIFEFLTVPSSSQQLLTFTRLALVNRLWRSVAVKFLYTSISHQSWKLRRVSRCLETLSLQRDTLSAARSSGEVPSLSLDLLPSSVIRRASAESDRSTLQRTSSHLLQQDDILRRQDTSIPPPILNLPAASNMLAATVTHLHLRIWSSDSDNTLSQLLLAALTNTINLATLSLSTSEMFAQHFELLLLRKGIIALESPSEPQPTLLTRSFLPCLTSLDVWPGFRLFQLTSGRPVRSVSSSTHITGDALKHLVPFFQRSLGPVQKVHFNVTARDTNAVADILRIIAWKLPCLVEVFFNVFVTKRGNSPKYSHDLLELLAPLSALQTVEILLSRHARSPDPDPYLYQHFAALHSLKATAPEVKHVVLDTIRWLYTSSTPPPALSSRNNTTKSSSQQPRRSSISSSTPPPISPVSTTSVSHSPLSSSGPSTPPSTGIGMSASSNPAIINPSTDNEQERQRRDERHRVENASILSPSQLIPHDNPSLTSSSRVSSLVDSSPIIDKPSPMSAYPPSPYTPTTTSPFYTPLTSDSPHAQHLEAFSLETTQNSPRVPVTPSTPRTQFPQTPITPGSFGAPDADLDSSPPSYTGWSPLPSDPRTHMWWLSTYGNAVDARLAMCAMWGSILGDSESDAGETREQNNSDALGVIPPLEEIGYMFGVDLASAGASDMFAVDMHSNTPHPNQMAGSFEIEEMS